MSDIPTVASSKKAKLSCIPTSLFHLPEEILLRILSDVASSSLDDIRRVELVSKSMHTLCNNSFIVANLPLNQVSLFTYPNNQATFNKFMKRCRQEGNHEAIYSKGLIRYFAEESDDNDRLKGLALMAKAAEKGIPEAKYVYGLILLCLGGERIGEALQIMNPLIKPSFSTTLKEVEALRVKNVYTLLWSCRTQMSYLKTIYTRAPCNCDGTTVLFLIGPGWCPYGSDHDIPSTSACPVCLWHYQAKRFFLY